LNLVDLYIAIPTNPGKGFAFAFQPLSQVGVISEFRTENLERYTAPFGIRGGVDNAVAASAKPSFQDELVNPLRITR
jgi:hypothetical protein